LPVVRKVSANARLRTTDVVISSADRASSWRCGDIGGVVTVGDGGADELAAAGVAGVASAAAAAGAGDAGDAGASASSTAAAAAAAVSASPLSAASADATGSFLGVSSLSNIK